MNSNNNFFVLMAAALVMSMALIFAPKAHADGTGVFVSGDGYIMTNRHVIFDGMRNPGTDYYILYHGSFVKATLVAFDAKHDLALMKVDIKSPCLRVAEHTIKVGDVLHLLMFDIRDLNYAQVENRRSVLDARVNQLISAADGFEHQSSFEFDPIIRPGNSGTPMLDDNHDIVGVGYAGLTSPEGFSIEAYGINNDFLMEFKKAHESEMTCYFPDRYHLKDNLVWIYEDAPQPPMVIGTEPVK